MPWLPWRREERDEGRHADPQVERASAELYGRMETLCEELESMIAARERELTERENGQDGDGGT